MKYKMPLIILFIAAMLIWSCDPNTAQGKDQPTMNDEACDAKLRSLMSKALTPESKFETAANICTITHLRFQKTAQISWSVDRLRIAKSSPSTVLGDALRAEAHGIRFSSEIGDARASYIINAQQRPFDARVDYVVDRRSGQLRLNDLTIESPSLGKATISLVADIKVTANDAFPDISKIAIRTIHITLENKFIFESMILPTWVNAVGHEDPETAIPKQLAIDEIQIAKLPASVIDPKGRDALIRFLKDMPHPVGRLDLNLVFAQPLKLKASADAFKGDAFWRAFTWIDARYEPLPASAR